MLLTLGLWTRIMRCRLRSPSNEGYGFDSTPRIAVIFSCGILASLNARNFPLVGRNHLLRFFLVNLEKICNLTVHVARIQVADS
jgi:hypothetical protein